MSVKIAVIGECMLEFTNPVSNESKHVLEASISYGGDTLNTAVYLARLGLNVDYITALGSDSMSGWMIDQWTEEGVGCDLIKRREGRVPGIYMIETDESGERTFSYWRNNSPARELFDNPEEARLLFSTLHNYPWIYLSGITLALYSKPALQRLFCFLAEYRVNGGKVIFDGNCRPALWESPEFAKMSYETMYQLTDIALSTLGDETPLFGEESAEVNLNRLKSYEIAEIALKMGELGALVSTPTGEQLVETVSVNAVDTTAAGDSFNAGYLAARLHSEKNTVDAARAGHRLASEVILHRGAIIAKENMPQ